MTKASKIKDFFHLYWNDKDSHINEMHEALFNKNILIHSPLGNKVGIESIQNINLQWMSAFPDMKISNLDLQDIGSVIVADWDSHGTHENAFKNLEPTGQKVAYHGTTIFCFENTKVVNYACTINMEQIYRQLGFFLKKEEYKNQNTLKNNYTLLIAKIQEVHSQALTAREIEILSCWIHGYSAKEIGQVFDISYRTVQKHLENAMLKLHCISKFDLRSLFHETLSHHLLRDLYEKIMVEKQKIIL